jgi:RecA-family ATPase
MANDPNTISINPKQLLKIKNNQSNDWILKGLRRKSVAFIIAPPDSGKGYLCLSLAYELATQINLVGLRYEESPKLKTLYWPMEDRCENTADRLLAHFNDMSQRTQDDCINNIELYNKYIPITCSTNQQNTPVFYQCEAARKELIESAKKFDVLIIDTTRASMGSAHEVNDDLIINNAFLEIADKANVALIAAHHPTKSVSRGTEDVSSVSGSGLSYSLATARLHLFLDKQEKRNKPTVTRLLHTKANFLNYKKRLDSVIKWSENDLLYIDDNEFDKFRTNFYCITSNTKPTVNIKHSENIKAIEINVPKVFNVTQEEIEQTTSKVINPNIDLVDHELLEKLKRYREKNKK